VLKVAPFLIIENMRKVTKEYNPHLVEENLGKFYLYDVISKYDNIHYSCLLQIVKANDECNVWYKEEIVWQVIFANDACDIKAGDYCIWNFHKLDHSDIKEIEYGI
jgi:hypothetical protein